MKGLMFLIGWLLAAISHLILQILILIIKIFNFQDKPVIRRIFGKSIGTKIQNMIELQEVRKNAIPESFNKGEKFEEYIRKNIFNKEKFVVVERTHNYETNKDDYVESTLKPDFKFRSKATNEEFYIEAKWRSNLYEGLLKWTNPNQLKRYMEYSKELPVYVVIGVGGNPSNPEKLYLTVVNMKTRIQIEATELDKFELSGQLYRYKLN